MPAKLKTESITQQISSFAALISRQITLYESLEDTKAELFDEQSAAKLREQYIAILGHDIRTPLSSIKMGIDFLSDLPQEHTAKTILKRMNNSVSRMTRLISDVMDFTHGKMGSSIPLEKKHINNLGALLRYNVSELELTHSECAIKYHININTSVFCDPDRLSQVLSNLLTNAIVHGDITKPIHVYADLVDNELIIRVTNSGEPIAKESMSRLFQPFWRHEKQKDAGGLGLGLFIASQIAAAHEGVLSVNSDKKQTEFVLAIPT